MSEELDFDLLKFCTLWDWRGHGHGYAWEKKKRIIHRKHMTACSKNPIRLCHEPSPYPSW